MEDEQRPLVLRFTFQFRLSFVLKSSMWMRTNQGVQLVCQRAGLPSRGTRTGQGNGPTGTSWNPTGTNRKPHTWGGQTPCSDTGWALPGLRAALPNGPGGAAGWTWASRAAKTAKCLPGCIKIIDSSLREVISPLYWALVRPPDPVWDTQYKKNIKLEGVRGGHQAGGGRIIW